MLRTEVVRKNENQVVPQYLHSFVGLTMLSTAKPSARKDPVRRLIFPNPLISQYG